MRIAMIEDEARIASFVKSGLESEGFLVEHADDGAAGLELVLYTDPDLVILDLIFHGWAARRCSAGCAEQARRCPWPSRWITPEANLRIFSANG